jgi:hypothetical protein
VPLKDNGWSSPLDCQRFWLQQQRLVKRGSGDGQEFTFHARLMCSIRRVRARIPNARAKGSCMSNKPMIWAEAYDFTGWCCSHCSWGISARLESTVAALAFNRIAQETFEKHVCADTSRQDRQ